MSDAKIIEYFNAHKSDFEKLEKKKSISCSRYLKKNIFFDKNGADGERKVEYYVTSNFDNSIEAISFLKKHHKFIVDIGVVDQSIYVPNSFDLAIKNCETKGELTFFIRPTPYIGSGWFGWALPKIVHKTITYYGDENSDDVLDYKFFLKYPDIYNGYFDREDGGGGYKPRNFFVRAGHDSDLPFKICQGGIDMGSRQITGNWFITSVGNGCIWRARTK